MRLAEAFPEELPTRPDNPTCAPHCKHCLHVFGDHHVSVPPVPPRDMWEAECFGMRTNFDGVLNADPNR